MIKKILMCLVFINLLIIGFSSCDYLLSRKAKAGEWYNTQLEIKHNEAKDRSDLRERKFNFSIEVENCYEEFHITTWGSEIRIRTLDQCLESEECSECLDNLMQEFEFSEEEGLILAGEVYNTCFINTL